MVEVTAAGLPASTSLRSKRVLRCSYRQTRTEVQTFLKFTQRHCFSIRQRGSAEIGVTSIAAAQTLPIRAKAKNARMT